MTSTVSFTVRRPTPVSRPSSSGPESDRSFRILGLPRRLASAGSSAVASPLGSRPESDDDDDDDGQTGIIFANDVDSHHTESSDEENLVATTRRLHKKQKVYEETPLIIPSQPNPDWREAARRRRAACTRIRPHASDSDLATTGADGTVGGLGTRDKISSGPQLSGLQIKKNVDVDVDVVTLETDETVLVIEETDDLKALRAILAGETGSASAVDIIPVLPLSEADALKQDVEELPDVATEDDYERVPISVFGAAMLRGMGWTDGAVAPKLDKRRKNGRTELYLPQARTALLGIGAKERELEDDGGGKKMRFIPVARRWRRR